MMNRGKPPGPAGGLRILRWVAARAAEVPPPLVPAGHGPGAPDPGRDGTSGAKAGDDAGRRPLPAPRCRTTVPVNTRAERLVETVL